MAIDLDKFRVSPDAQEETQQTGGIDLESFRATQPQKKEGIFSRIFKRTKGIIGRRAEKLGEIADASQSQSLTESAFQTAGAAVGGIGEAAFGVVAEATPEFIKQPLIEAVEKVAPALEPLIREYDEFAEANPRLARNIEAALEISEVVPGVAAGKVGKKATEQVARQANKVRVARIAKIDNQINKLVGSVAQGKKADISPARRALSEIDTRGVRTFDDLDEVSNDRVKWLSNKQTEILGQDQTKRNIEEFARTKKVGKQSVTDNPIDDALNDLEELYTKTKEPDKLARIKDIKDRATTEGLVLGEINDIAKEYGIDFGDKAFSKRTGEALTSVNAQRYENTRKAVKDTFRDKLPDDVSKAIDAQISDSINLRRLARNNAEKANKLLQRVKERGLIERISRRAGLTINALTGGGAKAFISSFLPSNVGNKVLNSLDIQERLKKSLKKIDDLMEKTDSQLEKELTNQLKTRK